MSLLELPVIGGLHFRLISEKFFTHIVSPTIWGKMGVEFVTVTSQRLSDGVTPMAIPITDGVGKGDIGMVATFCSHNQTKMEASKVLTACHQCDSPEPRVFMVRRYTNTPFIPQGTSRILYLDVSDLHRALLPNFLWTTCIFRSYFHILRLRYSYPIKKGRQDTEHTAFPQRFYRNALKSHAASPTQCHY